MSIPRNNAQIRPHEAAVVGEQGMEETEGGLPIQTSDRWGTLLPTLASENCGIYASVGTTLLMVLMCEIGAKSPDNKLAQGAVGIDTEWSVL